MLCFVFISVFYTLQKLYSVFFFFENEVILSFLSYFFRLFFFFGWLGPCGGPVCLSTHIYSLHFFLINMFLSSLEKKKKNFRKGKESLVIIWVGFVVGLSNGCGS